MIAIIDYGLGNVYSVSKALESLGYPSMVTSDHEQIKKASGIILPGVGAFGDGMRELAERGLISLLKSQVLSGKPLLGICLGMQLLFTSGDENGFHQGLNILSGHVKKLQVDDLIPHMGWNWLTFKHPHPLFRGLMEGHVYFVHSYYVESNNSEDIIATTDYHLDIPAIVARGNVMGMQFHPEKSGELGLQLLDQFVLKVVLGGKSI